jgi:hypothetical protein
VVKAMIKVLDFLYTPANKDVLFSRLASAFIGWVILLVTIISAPRANGYPQYQAFVEKHSGRTVNCSMCHVNENGPVGNGVGQIGSLTAPQMAQLNEEHLAMAPGIDVHSPILNRFGNQIIKELGRAKFLQTMSNPAKLAEALGDKSDLDGDGISDAQEYLDGTDPLNKFHGDAWRMFWINLGRYKKHILLTAIAMALLTYGLSEIYKGFYLQNKKDNS